MGIARERRRQFLKRIAHFLDADSELQSISALEELPTRCSMLPTVGTVKVGKPPILGASSHSAVVYLLVEHPGRTRPQAHTDMKLSPPTQMTLGQAP